MPRPFIPRSEFPIGVGVKSHTPIVRGSGRSVAGEARKAFRVEGLDEILHRISAVMNAVTAREAKQVYYDAAERLRDRARANAPYDSKRTRGWHLRDAIFVDWGAENKPTVLVGVRYGLTDLAGYGIIPGTGAPHAHLVEYGSARSSARPYMRPAISQEAGAIASDIKRGLLKIVEGATK